MKLAYSLIGVILIGMAWVAWDRSTSDKDGFRLRQFASLAHLYELQTEKSDFVYKANND